MRKRLSAVSEYEKEMFGGTIGVALKPALYVPLDEVVDDLVKQILEWIERLRN